MHPRQWLRKKTRLRNSKHRVRPLQTVAARRSLCRQNLRQTQRSIHKLRRLHWQIANIRLLATSIRNAHSRLPGRWTLRQIHCRRAARLYTPKTRVPHHRRLARPNPPRHRIGKRHFSTRIHLIYLNTCYARKLNCSTCPCRKFKCPQRNKLCRQKLAVFLCRKNHCSQKTKVCCQCQTLSSQRPSMRSDWRQLCLRSGNQCRQSNVEDVRSRKIVLLPLL